MLRVKDSLSFFIIIIFIYHEIQEYTCFKIKIFDVPKSVTVGSPANLKCFFELGQDKLVNLKWYFNDKEILRFEPRSIKDEIQTFNHGVAFNIDKNKIVNSLDRGSMLHITHVDKTMSGRYKCEVTIERQFYTTQQEQYMEVINQIITTTTTARPMTRSYPKAKSMEIDNNNIDDESTSYEGMSVVGSGCLKITLQWFNIILSILLIVYGLLFVMH